MVQVQLRVPNETVRELDRWVKKGKFKSRSDAIKTAITIYEDREKTREFYKLLIKRSKEVKEQPEKLIALEEL
ncbi:MAG: ribbon-helix-helix domain-containing protein [archaeon]